MTKQLLKRALDALEWAGDLTQVAADHKPLHDTIDALRAALAQPAPEPVAYGMRREDGQIFDCISPAEQSRYPGEYTVPLYATPQQAQPTENPWKDAVLDRLASASIDAPTDEFPSRILDRIIEVEIMIAKELTPAPAPAYTEGHCTERAKKGGCQLHNLHCGYPACDRKSAAPAVQPLTDEQIDEIWDGSFDASDPKRELSFRQTITRAIEQAHGITGGGNG